MTEPPLKNPIQESPPLQNPVQNKKSDNIRWGFFISFSGRKDSKKTNLDLLEQVQLLLNTCKEGPSDQVVDRCKEFIALHRVTENTDARVRLERWVTRVIVFYLLIIGLIIIVCGFKIGEFELSQGVIIALLSTTTANILGLGFIILKGHFSDKKSVSNEYPCGKACEESEH